MIEIENKSDCCGCTACANECPKNCIVMEADVEGFLYPKIDSDKCVSCGACDRVCPILNLVKEEKKEQKAYLVQHKDEAVRLDSSAGGAFTAIASYVVQKNGVVFGAAYDETFQVCHKYVDNVDGLKIFRNSKYVQSKLGDCYRQVKDFLETGRWVCFSGTPCQIEGLSRYVGKQYEQLVLVDVVCHGISSPLIWNKYLEYQKVGERKIENIRFRDKYYGYKYSTMTLIKGGKKVYHAGSQMDPMLRAFFTDMSDRPSCYDCPFKKRYRVCDMTIWDCFSVYDFDKRLDDDKGTTRVLCHTEKGTRIVRELKKETVRCKEVDPLELVSNVKEMFESVVPNPMREQFFKEAQKLSGSELFEKYFPITAKTKLKTVGRKALLVTGAYAFIKKGLNKLRGR